MDLSWRFDLWYRNLPKSPRDSGRVEGLVLRPFEGGSGARKIVESMRVTPERGIEGDRWARDEARTGNDQITLINSHVLQSIAGVEPERRALSGDNIHADLELSEENLPPGTKLRIGSAVLVVSMQPHMPCGKFLVRYGIGAVKKVLRANKRGRRGRGVVCMVEQAGEFRVGDEIRVVRSE